MRLGGFSVAFSLCAALSGAAMGQSARIETQPLRLMDPDPYQVTGVLELARRVKIIAPFDGLIRSVDARLGSAVRESHELVQLDPTDAKARLRIAEAEVKEKRVAAGATGTISETDRAQIERPQSGAIKAIGETARAQLEAAEARVELARAAYDRCTIRAPFAGRVFDVAVGPGQYVLKGTVLVELADTSSLRRSAPVHRRSVSVGSTIAVPVEEQEVSGKVQAILPLPEPFLVLRELATPFAAASVVFSNTRGELDAGLRACPAGVPTTAIANIARRAVRADDVRGAASSMVQVIRNEYVTNVSVHVLGGLGPDRVQVSGQFRTSDALIVGSSVSLVPGTLVRFNEGAAARGIEATSPNPAHGGFEAGITPPGGGIPATSGRNNRRTGAVPRPTNPPAQSQAGGATPF